MASVDTFPKLLEENAARIGDKPAIREKEFGIWQTSSWSDVREQVRALACGFADLGLERGDKLVVIGDNRRKLYWSMAAAQALGAVPVPVYQDAAAKELRFVLDHADVRFAVAEDQEQVDKLLEIIDDCPKLETIIYYYERGMQHYDQSSLHSLEDVLTRGRAYDEKNPDFHAAEIAKGSGKDVAILMYTSGTTGQPKGVLLSYDNLMIQGRNHCAFDKLTSDEEIFAYLPMAWVGDNIFSFAESYIAGYCVNCPESAATVMQDLREIGPTCFFAVPAIWENLLTTVMIRMEDAGRLKRNIFHYFMNHAKRVGTRLLDHQPVSPWDRFKYWLGDLLVYGPLKNTLGFSRIRLAYTAGEAIGPDLFDFFRSLGLNMKQLYGSTEASVFVTIQPDGEVKQDTVGAPAPDVDIKISGDGEVMYRGPGVFLEYYKNPKATKEAKTEDGWVHTGDAGIIGKDGHLKIIDRVKDVGRLNDETMFAPKYIENKLKFSPYIREVVAFGDKHDYATAMVSIELEAVSNWAERRNLSFGGYQDLADRDEVYDLIKSSVEQANRDLAADPQLAGSQIKRFLLLHKELDADDGELTRTRKVRRGFIAEKYAQIVDALYGGKDHVEVEAEMTFEDGRTGVIKADLKVRDARTFATQDIARAGDAPEGEGLRAAG